MSVLCHEAIANEPFTASPQTQAEFQQSATNELGQQMLVAMKLDQGIKRNEEKITAAKRRITGAGQ